MRLRFERGAKLGSYEIVEPIGAGGMGEVYRAHDPELGRDIAIKVLPSETASDPERLRRFEHEARAASALSHPNIVTIYEIGEHEGTRYLAMEYVAGATLRKILTSGALAENELLRYSRQLAEGLAKAHAAGIVHRDLKPDNIIISEDSYVKILDFGLAKLTERPAADDALTLDKRAPLTSEGHILGTANYMSPEQAQGNFVDARSDVFSFGSIVYEMATGTRAFDGNNVTAVLASILRDEPRPVSDRVPQTPTELEALVNRCLRKDRDRRLQSMSEARAALEDLEDALRSGERSTSVSVLPRRAPKRLWWIVAGIAVVLLGVVLTPVSRDEPEPSIATTPATSFPGREEHPNLSPDGRFIAFTWAEKGEIPQLYVRRLRGGEEPLRLTEPPGDVVHLAWSPDGTEIAYHRHVLPETGEPISREAQESAAGHAIYSVSMLGGEPRRLAATGNVQPHALAWSPDGSQVVIVDRETGDDVDSLYSVSTVDGASRRLTTPASGYEDSRARFSPDGTKLAFIRGEQPSGNRGELYVLDLNEAEPSRITTDLDVESVDWWPDGQSVVVVSNNRPRGLWRVPPRAEATPERLPFGDGARRVSTSRDAANPTLVFSLRDARFAIWRSSGPAAPERRPRTKVIESTRYDTEPSYSPDGQRVAFQSDRRGTIQLHVSNADGTNTIRLSDVPTFARPSWSPDGRRIAVRGAIDPDNSDVLVFGVEGGPPARLTTDPAEDWLPSWSPEGGWIYFASNRSSVMDIFRVPSSGGEVERLTATTGATPMPSSDGRYLYYSKASPTPDRSNIWRLPLSGGEPELVLDRRPSFREWTLWQDQVVYIEQEKETGPSIDMLDPETGEITVLEDLGRGSVTNYGISVSRDGLWVLYTMVEQEGDIMLVEGLR